MDKEILLREISYKTARSGGSGGQHVNKVETKVEARFSPEDSTAFDEAEKALLLEKLSEKISSDGILSVTSQTERSQAANKELATLKLVKLLESALVKPKLRKKSKIPQGVSEARVEQKRRNADKKAGRKKPPLTGE